MRKLVVVLTLIAACGITDLHGEELFRVNVALANVRTAPTTSSRTVAQVPRHVVLPVLGEEDGWVRVQIADVTGQIRIGYIKATLGRIEQFTGPTAQPTAPAPAESANQPSANTRPAPGADEPVGTSHAGGILANQAPSPAPQPSLRHIPGQPSRFALGARAGGFALGFGGSLRHWASDRLGVEALISHYSLGYAGEYYGVRSEAGAGVLQIAPSVLYRFGSEGLDDGVMVRPYVGGGISITRTSMSASASGFGESVSESSSTTDVGFQGLGGVELRFESVPRLGVSADLGYYSNAAPFAGISFGGIGLGVSAHWYFR